MNRELLMLVEAISREKNVERDVVFGAVESALAQATTRLRLGTMVTGIHYRHPAVLANMAAAVDIISDGRLELGVGALLVGAEQVERGTAVGKPHMRGTGSRPRGLRVGRHLVRRLRRAVGLGNCRQRRQPPRR